MLTYLCTTFPLAFLVLTSPPYPTAAFTVLPHCLHCLIPAVALPHSSLPHPLAGCPLKAFSDTISPTGHSSTSWAREAGLPRIPSTAGGFQRGKEDAVGTVGQIQGDHVRLPTLSCNSADK